MTSHIVGVETKRESGLCLYRWRCSCTKTGKDWTARIFAARRGGAYHARKMEAGVGAGVLASGSSSRPDVDGGGVGARSGGETNQE